MDRMWINCDCWFNKNSWTPVLGGNLLTTPENDCFVHILSIKDILIVPKLSNFLQTFVRYLMFWGKKVQKQSGYCTQKSVFDQFHPFRYFDLFTVELDNIGSESVIRIKVPSQYSQIIWTYFTFVIIWLFEGKGPELVCFCTQKSLFH